MYLKSLIIFSWHCDRSSVRKKNPLFASNSKVLTASHRSLSPRSLRLCGGLFSSTATGLNSDCNVYLILVLPGLSIQYAKLDLYADSREVVMQEVPIRIPVSGGEISLEGLFHEGKNGRTPVLCHPHPLYGGNMENNVVLAARHALAACGWATLRFNFRGVGGSGGQPGQCENDARDLIAVSEFLRSKGFRSKDSGTLDLAAYSYGAWVALEAIRHGLLPDSLLLFSPPLDFMSFDELKLPTRPALITIGNQDEFCSVESLKKWLSSQPDAKDAVLEILPYCDHFYWDFGNELSAKIKAFLKKNFP